MRLTQNPTFRRVIIPWYDSDPACYIMSGLMALVAVFGLTGIYTAGVTQEYHSYIWVPILLFLLSTTVCIIVTVRLIRRYVDRHV